MASKRCAPRRTSQLEEAERLFGVNSIEEINEMVARFGRMVSILEDWTCAERGCGTGNGGEGVMYTNKAHHV